MIFALRAAGPLALGLSVLLGACAVAPSATGPAAAASARPRIDKAADMPRFSYPVKRDAEAVLAGYEIADKAVQRDLLTQLAVIDYLEGRYDAALARMQRVIALEDKPAEKFTSGLRLRAVATAARQHPPGTPAHARAVAEFLNAELAKMPYDVVGNDIREIKAGAELSGEGGILGRVREVLQPLVDTNGQLTLETAPGLALSRYALTVTLPLKETWVQTFSAWLAKNKVVKPDIWASRNISLPAAGNFTRVPLAVWDSGVDTALFKAQRVVDGAGNPLVIGFDKYARPAPTELAPLPAELRAKLPQMVARSKGFSDLQSDIDSPEAAEVKRLLSALTPEQYKPVVEEINLVGNYEHGTHVAGIALDGNPHARLVVARIEFGHTLKPDPCPSREWALRDAVNNRATVEFFLRHGVRVVNMSWGGSVGDVERELEQCGIGANADARKSLARELFDITKKSLTEAMAAAPGILFIAAAGNENQDSGFAESTPADIVLPNLLTVGAVDQAGDEAGFTSYGATVKLHANGYQVESYLPGGSRVALSGTSMAAPQAANLAAKLLAVKPTLTPVQLIDVMTRTADRSADGRRVLMNPKRAMATLQAG